MHTQHYVKRYILVLFIPYKRQGHKNRRELSPEMYEMGQEMHVAVRHESICCAHARVGVLWLWVLCTCDY
jgi:hypothetical protein